MPDSEGEPEMKRPRLGDDDDPEGGEEDPQAQEEDGLEGFGDDAELQALAEADNLQQQLEKVNDEASDRVLAVEQEFNARRRPIYARRNASLAKIPGFWKKVLFIHPVIRGTVSEADLDVMDYLEEVDVEDFEDIKSGFRLRFTFAEGNPYFSNRELTKEIRFADDASLTVTGTTIQWLPGKEPSFDAGDGAPLHPETQYSLFAAWFDGQATQLMGHDDVADVLKDDIWPDPLRWYREAEEGMASGLFGAPEEGDEYDEEGDDEFDDGDDEPGGEDEVEIVEEEQEGDFEETGGEGDELPDDGQEGGDGLEYEEPEEDQ